MTTNYALDGLIVDDMDRKIFKVNRRVFTDPEILEAEKRLVFDRCWLYVGHESEVPEKGSFVKRSVAGKPIIMTRDNSNAVRVFYDACTHRGNSICRGVKGKTDRFLCFYHGWAFNTSGELVVLPDPRGYGEKPNLKQYNLVGPARVESYRGMVFMCADVNAVDLKTYLGGVTEYIDLVLDLSDSVAEIAVGEQNYTMKANWKLLLENSADAYHAPFTHQRFFAEHVREAGVDPGSWNMWSALPENVAITFPNGHAVVDAPAGPLPFDVDNPKEAAEVRRRLEAKYGKERTHRILDYSRNIMIFPNTVMIGIWRTIRTFYPIAPDMMECKAWSLVGAEDTPEIRKARFANFACFLGPAGFGTPDDVEGLEGCQKGFAATEAQWTDLSKGMARAGGAIANDEIQMRNIWRKWYSLMNSTYKPSVELSSAMPAAAE